MYSTYTQQLQALKIDGAYGLIANDLSMKLGSKGHHRLVRLEMAAASANGENPVAAAASFAAEQGWNDVLDMIIDLVKMAPLPNGRRA